MNDLLAAENVTVPRADLIALLDGNLEAANIALSIHSLIDAIEERGGPNSEDDTEQMAYHLYYTLSAASRLRAIVESDKKNPPESGGQGEAVAWQMSQMTARDAPNDWTPWKECTKWEYESIVQNPLKFTRARALYAAPAQPDGVE